MRDNSANPRLLENVSTDTRRDQILRLDQSCGQQRVTLRSGLYVKNADVVIGLPSRHFDADAQRYGHVVAGDAFDESDPPAEERPDVGGVRKARDVEDTRAFEKER